MHHILTPTRSRTPCRDAEPYFLLRPNLEDLNPKPPSKPYTLSSQPCTRNPETRKPPVSEAMEVELDRSQLEERFDVIALEAPKWAQASLVWALGFWGSWGSQGVRVRGLHGSFKGFGFRGCVGVLGLGG